ncbi:hypothetical protein PYW07_011943 [Mythimna separata]|uniref:Uncharacterized protein n=1 Tax=Mythimna separata TaxID=271217 RepID=A0AAD7YL96_MYTSE|nr:hypothetical protein PYW07_011943 [Mythimna separata]
MGPAHFDFKANLYDCLDISKKFARRDAVHQHAGERTLEISSARINKHGNRSGESAAFQDDGLLVAPVRTFRISQLNRPLCRRRASRFKTNDDVINGVRRFENNRNVESSGQSRRLQSLRARRDARRA